MGKYLDSTGLSRVWDKVKDYIANAISPINDKLTAETFTGTRSSSISGGALNGVYDKASGTVRINLFWANPSTNIGTSATLFTVPAAYRPSATKTGSGITRTSDNIPLASTYSITSSGVVTQGATSSGRGGLAVIEYTL